MGWNYPENRLKGLPTQSQNQKGLPARVFPSLDPIQVKKSQDND